MKASPKLSIITINYNNKDGLEKTIASVSSQTYTDFEYLIIDGGSTDGSRNYIASQQTALTYWVSEPDRGIYHAMNKGITKAKGEYILFLNSGDYLLENSSLAKVFDEQPTADILYGNLKSDYRDFIYPEQITLLTFVTSTIPHQASFIKRHLFHSIGEYDTTYPVIADWVFFVKAVMVHKVSYQYFNQFISFFESGGISTEKERAEHLMQRRANLLFELFPDTYPDYEHLLNELNLIKAELRSYNSSRLIQAIRCIQKRILKSR